MKILAIQNRMGIGDTVIFLPYLKAISQKFNSPISLLVKESSKADQYLNETDYIKEIIILDRNKNSNIVEIVWAGEETMSKTFWIYCILTVAIVSFLSGLALTFLGNIMWLIPVSVIIWSNTGLWRSSNFYQNEKLKNKQSYGWATAAKVYVVLNYITTLSQIGLSLNV